MTDQGGDAHFERDDGDGGPSRSEHAPRLARARVVRAKPPLTAFTVALKQWTEKFPTA